MKNRLFYGQIFFTCLITAATTVLHGQERDPGRSSIIVIARSVEGNAPVAGEPVAVRITLKDNAQKPVSGVNGANIRLFIEDATGKMEEMSLTGKTASDGIIYGIFRNERMKLKSPIRFAVQVNGKILQETGSIKYSDAAESIDQGQPLWNGSNRIFGNKTIGQKFVCGNITEISRIKVMFIRSDSAKIALPVLKLYEWNKDYKSTVSAAPVATRVPSFNEGRSSEKDVAIYAVETAVKAGKQYYFELEIPDKSGDENNCINVYRTWNHPGSNTPSNPDSYPHGDIYFNGQEIDKSDLAFYTFYKNNRTGK